MSEHDWPGWPDDHAGGDPPGPGGPAHDLSAHDGSADDPWGGHLDAPRHQDPAYHDDPAPHDQSALHDPAHDAPAPAGPVRAWLDDPLTDTHHTTAADAHQAAGPGDAPDAAQHGDTQDGDGLAGHGAAGSAMGPVGADPDAEADLDPGAATVFPPPLHVGPLPEPVDGLPWIDTASLGVVAPGGAALDPPTVDPVQHSADLAAYAGVELPPAADPWAALAASDDPATSALARWWAPEA